MNALGLIEIQGLTAAIVALDEMTKTAEVEIVTWEKKLGGRLVTVIVRGNVSSVKEAVEVGIEKAGKVGRVAASAIIPNPHPEVLRMANLSAEKGIRRK